MKMNKKTQNALLLALYISRGGRVTLESAAEGLNLSKEFLYQIANILKKYNVIRSIRGRNGGYELVGAPSVNQIMSACGSEPFLTDKEKNSFRVGTPEHRALGRMIDKAILAFFFKAGARSIQDVMQELTDSEMVHFSKNDHKESVSQ